MGTISTVSSLMPSLALIQNDLHLEIGKDTEAHLDLAIKMIEETGKITGVGVTFKSFIAIVPLFGGFLSACYDGAHFNYLLDMAKKLIIMFKQLKTKLENVKVHLESKLENVRVQSDSLCRHVTNKTTGQITPHSINEIENPAIKALFITVQTRILELETENDGYKSENRSLKHRVKNLEKKRTFYYQTHKLELTDKEQIAKLQYQLERRDDFIMKQKEHKLCLQKELNEIKGRETVHLDHLEVAGHRDRVLREQVRSLEEKVTKLRDGEFIGDSMVQMGQSGNNSDSDSASFGVNSVFDDGDFKQSVQAAMAKNF